MPDLCQIEQTCLPTSTSNLIVWFGTHGYPKLIMDGDSRDNGYIHTVHRIMADTDARFDWGTKRDAITIGIEKYIHDAGYDGTAEYRGMNAKKPFSADWLKDNDDPNKGFILLLSYCFFHPENDTFTDAWNAGHAVTLVNAEPDMILIHDPAHEEDETGRKIITPQLLTEGTWDTREGKDPVAGLLLLSGSLLEGPPDSQVMLTGAVCITMHPPGSTATPSSSPVGSDGTVGGTPTGSTPTTPSSPPPSANSSLLIWIFDLLFGK